MLGRGTINDSSFVVLVEGTGSGIGEVEVRGCGVWQGVIRIKWGRSRSSGLTC